MKKQYESPLAEKYEFDYLENVVASGLVTEASTTGDIAPRVVMVGKNNPSGCFTGNKSADGCEEKKK